MRQITFISILLLLISSTTFAQVTIGRQVIGSTGGFHQVPGGNSYSYTVGETVVQTTQQIFSANLILTQGFQQPILTNGPVLSYEVINESCPGANNGSIYIDDV